MRVITDADLDAVPAVDAVDAMLDALRLRASHQFHSPPRVTADLGLGRVVLTAGAGPGWYGYRVYDTLPTIAGQQVVALHEAATGDILALHVGNRLGAMRTGALGGAAARFLGPPHPARVALIGAGRQAWAQLRALTGVLQVTGVTISSRTASSCENFAARARSELNLDAHATSSNREAVSQADIVVLATTSSSPVLDSAWLKDDVMVTTVGPKQLGRCEFDSDLLNGADLTVTDAPEQLHAYDPPALAATIDTNHRIVDLATLSGPINPNESRTRAGRRVYLSVGLAGTEAHLLHHLTATGSYGVPCGVDLDARPGS